LPADTEYPGSYGFIFEKAVSGWWLGRREESSKLFDQLLAQDIAQNYRSTIEYNLKIMNPEHEKLIQEK
jgi:hypothetical protein